MRTNEQLPINPKRKTGPAPAGCKKLSLMLYDPPRVARVHPRLNVHNSRFVNTDEAGAA